MSLIYLYLFTLADDDDEPPFDAFLLASANDAAASDTSDTSDAARCIPFLLRFLGVTDDLRGVLALVVLLLKALW